MTAPITAFDRATCRIISQEATAALQAVAAKYGLSVMAGSGSFSPAAFTPKFTFSPMVAVTAAPQGTVPYVTAGSASSIPADFANKAALVGLQASDYGRTFTSQGKTFKITGINLKAHKFPILGTEIRTGKTFKFHADNVVRYLAR